MLPNRNSSIDEWITYDRTRPLFKDWQYYDVPYPLIYELYKSVNWRELEKLIIPHLASNFYYPRRKAMTFDELVEYIKNTVGITYSKFCVNMGHDGGPVVCATCIPHSITYKNYHIIRELLPPPPMYEPQFLQEADRPDLVPCIKHLYPNYDWFNDYEASDNWNITLIRYGIYPSFNGGNERDWLTLSKKDINKIRKKGYRLCVGNMRPKNEWEYDKARFLSLIGYKNAIPLEYYDLNKKYNLEIFMRYSDNKHVEKYLTSKGLYKSEKKWWTTNLDYMEEWEGDVEYVKTMKIKNAYHDITFILQ